MENTVSIDKDLEDKNMIENLPPELLDVVKDMSPEQAGGTIVSLAVVFVLNREPQKAKGDHTQQKGEKEF